MTNTIRKSECGVALPAALLMIMMVVSMTVLLTKMSIHNLNEISISQSTDITYLAAEGAVNKQISEMSVLGTQWEEKPAITSLPSGYTEYSPATYASSNGIPTCSGVACHRSMYPTGGGLLKNIGPVNGAGDSVDTRYSITDQLDTTHLATADLTLTSISAWTQVERLDEATPSASTVGGSLGNSIAEGGNSKVVRYRVTGTALKKLKGKDGRTTVVAVVEMALS